MQLKNMKIAILVANGFEQSEMTEPRKALEEEGAHTYIVSPEEGKVKGWKHTQWGDQFPVDLPLSEANANEFAALLLPGGVMNPDKLRMNEAAVSFVKEFAKADKPIAAICHGPWILIDAEIANGHTLTSWASIKKDLMNAGANWVDKSSIVDDNLVTSRKPDDIPEFNKAMIKLFAKTKELI